MINLKINNLEFNYSSGFNLNIQDLEFVGSEIVSIMGPNGHGKSTFFKLLMNLEKTNIDNIYINNSSLNQFSIIKRAQTFSYLPQFFDYDLNIKLSELFHYTRFAWMDGFRPLNLNERSYRDKILEFLGLSSFLNRKLGELSGGQLKLASIGATFFQGTKIVLLDEPFAALDPYVKNVAADFLRSSEINGSRLQFIISHDFYWSQKISDKNLIFNEGKVVHCFNKFNDSTKKILEEVFNCSFDRIQANPAFSLLLPGDKL